MSVGVREALAVVCGVLALSADAALVLKWSYGDSVALASCQMANTFLQFLGNESDEDDSADGDDDSGEHRARLMGFAQTQLDASFACLMLWLTAVLKVGWLSIAV